MCKTHTLAQNACKTHGRCVQNRTTSFVDLETCCKLNVLAKNGFDEAENKTRQDAALRPLPRNDQSSFQRLSLARLVPAQPESPPGPAGWWSNPTKKGPGGEHRRRLCRRSPLCTAHVAHDRALLSTDMYSLPIGSRK